MIDARPAPSRSDQQPLHRRTSSVDLPYSTRVAVMGSVVLLVLAVVYFGSIWDYGFDPGDVGSYAMAAYELAQGATPADLVLGYGPLWFYLGAAVFRFTDLGYPGIMFILYALAFLTALLAYLAVLECTRRPWLALAAGLLCLLVPPFPATVLRPFCVMLVVYLLLRLARRFGRAGPRDFAPPALAVALCWMMRPDLGYLLLGALVGVLVLWSLSVPAPFTRQLAAGLRAAVLVVATIAVAALPLVLDAVRRGYLDVVVSDLLSYPARLATVLLQPFGRTAVGPGAPPEAGMFLQRLPLQAMVGPDPFQRAFAVLMYSAVLVLGAYTLYVVAAVVRRPRELHQHATPVVVLVAGLSQFPIFYFFRPGWAHFGTFVLTYAVLVAYTAHLLISQLRAAQWGTPRRTAAGLALLALTAQMALFVATGLQAPGVGALAQVADRSASFVGDHHLEVRVTPAEHQALEDIATVIRATSAPDERIVCVPYCAGYPFMAGRRMLFKNFYVDDAFLVHTPGWMAEAIRLTEEQQPPLIVVLDWAVNGTDVSRFPNWARPYMDYVRAHYPYEVPIVGGSAFLARPLAGAPALTPEAMQITAYGPSSTRIGVPFSAQPDGSSAMWLQVPSPQRTWVVVFDGQRLPTTVGPDLLTAAIPAELLVRPGHFPIQLLDTASGARSEPVYFDVVAE